MKKLFLFRITAVLFVISLFLTPIGASELDEILNAVPEDIRDELPKGEITVDSFGFDFIFEKLINAVKSAFSGVFSSFSKIIGILLISSATGIHFKDAIGGRMSEPVSILSVLSLAVITLGGQAEIFQKLSSAISSVTAFVTSTVPILSAMQAMTANTAGAAVTSQSFLYFSAAVEFVFSYICFPLFELFAAFSVVTAVTPSYSGLSSVTGILKRSLTLIITAASMIYVTVLSYQTELAAAADSVLSRSVKFAVSSSIPIIGSSVGDAVRTTMSSFSVIKNSSGALGIVVILLLTVPIAAELLIMSLSYSITASAAKLLGCEREASLLTELRTVTDFASATLSAVIVVFIISLAVFIKTAPALTA